MVDDTELDNAITGYWAKRSWVGSCNGCQNRDDDNVAEIHLRTTSFRLCGGCLTAMADLLTNMVGEQP